MSEDPLTLEKMKIDERLRSLEIQSARLVSHLESEQGTFVRIQTAVDQNLQRIMKIIERHEVILFGDNDAGIITKIDRQEQLEEGRKWHFRFIWAAIVSMFIKMAADLFKR